MDSQVIHTDNSALANDVSSIVRVLGISFNVCINSFLQVMPSGCVCYTQENAWLPSLLKIVNQLKHMIIKIIVKAVLVVEDLERKSTLALWSFCYQRIHMHELEFSKLYFRQLTLLPFQAYKPPKAQAQAECQCFCLDRIFLLLNHFSKILNEWLK